MVKTSEEDLLEPAPLPQEIPECNKFYDIYLGESLKGTQMKNYSLRYAFLPRSVENQRYGEADFNDRGVSITHASKDYEAQTHFRGVKTAAKNEDFILVFRDGKFFLEKLHVKVTNLIKHDGRKLLSTNQSKPFRSANQLNKNATFKAKAPEKRLNGTRSNTKVLEPNVSAKTKSKPKKRNAPPNIQVGTKRKLLPKKSKLPKRQRQLPAPNIPRQYVPSQKDFERNLHTRRSNIVEIEKKVEPERPSGPVGLDGSTSHEESKYEGEDDDDIVDQSALFSSDSEDD